MNNNQDNEYRPEAIVGIFAIWACFMASFVFALAGWWVSR